MQWSVHMRGWNIKQTWLHLYCAMGNVQCAHFDSKPLQKCLHLNCSNFNVRNVIIGPCNHKYAFIGQMCTMWLNTLQSWCTFIVLCELWTTLKLRFTFIVLCGLKLIYSCIVQCEMCNVKCTHKRILHSIMLAYTFDVNFILC